MNRVVELNPEFVEFIPPGLKDGVIYISMTYSTASHKCCCGCGRKIVTPFSPTDWSLLFDGESISLHPSVGNWGLECQSHYWVTKNRIQWSPKWSQEEIDAGRARDRFAKERYFATTHTETDSVTKDKPEKLRGDKTERGFWSRLKKLWS